MKAEQDRLPVKMIRLQNGSWAIITGLKAKIDHPNKFLKRIKKKTSGLVIQTIDAKYVAGEEHIKLILCQSLEAFVRGINITSSLELELLARTMCDRQINRALATGGLKEGQSDQVIIGIGGKHRLGDFLNDLRGIGQISAEPLELTSHKAKFLKKHHGISDLCLETTVGVRNKLPLLLAEKATLLRK